MVTHIPIISSPEIESLSPAVHLTIVSDNLDSISVLISKATLQTVFQRALNTWADAPPELFTFCDQLEQL